MSNFFFLWYLVNIMIKNNWCKVLCVIEPSMIGFTKVRDYTRRDPYKGPWKAIKHLALGFTYHEMNEIWLQGTPLHERFVLYLKDPMVDHIQISCNLNRKAFMLFTLGKACSHRSPHLGYYLWGYDCQTRGCPREQVYEIKKKAMLVLSLGPIMFIQQESRISRKQTFKPKKKLGRLKFICIYLWLFTHMGGISIAPIELGSNYPCIYA